MAEVYEDAVADHNFYIDEQEDLTNLVIVENDDGGAEEDFTTTDDSNSTVKNITIKKNRIKSTRHNTLCIHIIYYPKNKKHRSYIEFLC
jgi:hypothetical protein